MSIPFFENEQEREDYLDMYERRLNHHAELMAMVKGRFYANTPWHGLSAKHLEVIEDIATAMSYAVDSEFKEKYPHHKNGADEIFIPHHSFKESVTEALLEANQKFWNSSKDDAPWCHPEGSITDSFNLGDK